MAARGSVAKEELTQKILGTFPNAFLNGKEIRIPMFEGGEEVQIKVTLTAAKENIDVGASPAGVSTSNLQTPDPTADVVAPSEEEKQTVADLLAKLGL